MESDHTFIEIALDEARAAAVRDEVPIGAVLVQDGRIVARNGNRTRELHDPTAHAEILCLREGCRRAGAQRIPECELFVTLEPCALCAAAISFARIRRVVFAAIDPKGGAILHGPRFYEQPTCHHRPLVAQEGDGAAAGRLLREFFSGKR